MTGSPRGRGQRSVRPPGRLSLPAGAEGAGRTGQEILKIRDRRQKTGGPPRGQYLIRLFPVLILVLLLLPSPVRADSPVGPAPAPKPHTRAKSAAALRFPIYQPPTKLKLCGEPVPLHKQSVYEMLDREFNLAVYDRAQVIMWLKRANRYFGTISKALREAGMPDDIKYLAVAESALKSYAFSSAGAAGFWQFLKSTGRHYGLRKSRHKDERLNVQASTRAALSYLRDLHEAFGSWALAMAAYNCGEKRVREELREQGVDDYFLLDLPLETERYIFRILSAKIILEDPEKYGYDLKQIRLYPPLEIKTVALRLKKKTHIRTVAKAALTYYKEIKELNPDIKGRYLQPGLHWISIPLRGAAGFDQRLARLGGKTAPAPARTTKKSGSRKKYIVVAGDNLSKVGRKLGVSPAHLVGVNRLKTTTLKPGQTLYY